MSQSTLVSTVVEAGLREKERVFLEQRAKKKGTKSEFVANFLKKKAIEFNNDPEKVVTCYPSESSIQMSINPTLTYTTLVGGCLRNAYFKRLNLDETNPDDIIGKRRMSMGVQLEKMEQDWLKRTGFCTATNKKFLRYIPEYNIAISGEIDMILGIPQDPATLRIPGLEQVVRNTVLVEMKTFYGYMARNGIFGSRYDSAKPKEPHILQLALYLDAVNCNQEEVVWMKEEDFVTSEDGKMVEGVRYVEDTDTNFKTNEGVLYYVDRGACDSMEHIVTKHDNSILINGTDWANLGFTYENIYGNYNQLAEAVRAKRMPARTSQYQYSENQVEYMISNGKIAKTKAANYKAGKCAIGDWMCLYCNYKALCLGTNPMDTENIPTDDSLNDAIKYVIDKRKEEAKAATKAKEEADVKAKEESVESGTSEHSK